MQNFSQELKTEIENIYKFNEVSGNEFGNSDVVGIYENLIEEEIEETYLAASAVSSAYPEDYLKQLVGEIIDGFGDTVVVTVGLFYGLGYNVDVIHKTLTEGTPVSINNDPQAFQYAEKIIESKTRLAKMIYGTSLISLIGTSLTADVLIEALKAINESNMSKFCTSEEEAMASVDAYANSDVYRDVYYEKVGDLFVIRGFKTKSDTEKAKILKSINYREPDLTKAIELFGE